MKDRAVTKWILVCFVLHCTAINITHSQECTASARGIIGVEGALGSNFYKGRVSICDGSEWRAVCDAGWDINDANVVCRQLGFPEEGTQFCTDSCYGSNDNIRGATNFACTGREQRLINCRHSNLQDSAGGFLGWQTILGRCNSEYAGVICTRPLATPTMPPPSSKATTLASPTSASTTSHDNGPLPTTSCDCTDTPTSCPETVCDCTDMPTTSPETSCDCTDTPTSFPVTSCDCTATPTSASSTSICSPCDCENISATTFSSESDTDNMVAGSTATKSIATPVLGVVIAVLLLTLVGIVLGWVWSCHRNWHAVKQQEGSADNNLTNPTYSAVTPTIPSVQYSSLGPQDTPTSSHTPGGEESVYNMLGEVGEGQEEGEGMAYEVPIQANNKRRNESAERAVEKEYSTLHHN